MAGPVLVVYNRRRGQCLLRMCGRLPIQGHVAKTDRGELGEELVGRFRWAYDQPSIARQRAVELPHDLVYSLRSEVHEHIPAEDHVETVDEIRMPGKRVIRQVELSKAHHLLDGGANGPTVFVNCLKICAPNPRRNPAERPLSVNS